MKVQLELLVLRGWNSCILTKKNKIVIKLS